ncbi:MAG: 50S ribosomal protein L5 [Candidatus Taylorbacteria bacterium RIFCSPLOWO2_12_FULL_47_20]|uniref:Large ribosomal subunit protein uL5 n=2 Tax=Candidatus Tayloriibacteriota TaxID=1817919 RepID=A0A1G2P716_9BACT|nr:MAG: 50S ribosomal protein L5 [Candidatus Taylorbacteria bacterium RIFCSPLOWO2_02_FULL_46_40]OHA44063.1 MAG: 50S ribosomal protein L5 [Candidatus Taylorbacteria bacterium RIFCSPLOWO2_12_FULL_47_20]
MHKNTKSVQEKTKGAFESMRAVFAYKNPMQAPKIEKVVVSVGFGSIKDKDKKKIDLIADRLSKITGQKPASRAAKKSIASFKLREGEPIGYQVTLRGPRMVGFLDKLLNIALPRTRDWRGIPVTAIDEIGNLTIGIKEHTIFPETSDEELKDVFGMAVTIVTSASNKEEAKAFLTHLGFPFRK